jgi:putative acetyltransferase
MAATAAMAAMAEESLRVREERPADFASVHAVQSAAFGRSGEADLVDALRGRAEPALSLVAELAGRIVGHVFFSPIRLEASGADAAPPVAGLAPIGVLPELQGRGIGARLVRDGLERCAALGWRAVFLVGDPGYYARFGFALAAPLGFRYQSEQFDPYLQVLELAPGALCGVRGPVHYLDVFDSAETEPHH